MVDIREDLPLAHSSTGKGSSAGRTMTCRSRLRQQSSVAAAVAMLPIVALRAADCPNPEGDCVPHSLWIRDEPRSNVPSGDRPGTE